MHQDDIVALVAAVPQPMVFVSPTERIRAINAPAEALLGKALIGRHYITALRQPLALDCIETALRLQEAGQAKLTRTEAGRETVHVMTATPVGKEKFLGVVLTFEDHTALQEVWKLRRDFVANVSHELRTPLTALLGFIETLRGAAKDDPAARERFLEIMEREAGRMVRLVRDLLSLSAVEEGARVRPTEEVDISALIQSVARSLEPVAENRPAVLRLEGLDTPHLVPGDPDQLRQVLTNLMENAIKYGKAGGEVYVSLTVHSDEPTLRGPAIRVDVADQGDGIEAHHIPRLTERFYRVDTHRSREMGGTGLGLAIVKHIVNRHRGRLRIESHRGQGSCFTVILPSR